MGWARLVLVRKGPSAALVDIRERITELIEQAKEARAAMCIDRTTKILRGGGSFHFRNTFAHRRARSKQLIVQNP